MSHRTAARPRTSSRFLTVHARYAALSSSTTAPVSSDTSVSRPSNRGSAGLNGFSICFITFCADTALWIQRCAAHSCHNL